jgi:nickel/cobalt transporter (NiCoT) family protein
MALANEPVHVTSGAFGPPLRLFLMLGGLALANVAAWAWAFAAFAERPALLGTALLAWVLGLRHAVDPDHIAAIDNVVRKLMQAGRKPVSAGLFFALGHSAIVVIAATLVALASAALRDGFDDYRAVGGVVSTSISALFLIGIGLSNLVILQGVWRSFQRARRGEPVLEEELNTLTAGKSLLARWLRPLFRVVTRSWHMAPLGFLFGLGFDTATELSLFAVAAAQASQGLSLSSILVFPVLFTVGMTLVDTLDSTLMVGAYGWAFVRPVRKLWYNLTITSVSVVVAFAIGGLEALGLLQAKLGLEGGFWSFIGELNEGLAQFGYLVVALFAASWILSFLIYRWQRFDDVVPPQTQG